MTTIGTINKREAAVSDLRVLIIAPSGKIVGGQSTQARRLLEKFVPENGLNVSFAPIDPDFPALIRPAAEIIYLRTIVRTFLCVVGLLKQIPRNDVIHIFCAAHFSFLLAPFPAVIIAKLFGKRTILNYRSGEAEEHLNNWRIAKPMLKMYDRIITPSYFLVDVFAKFGINASSIFNTLPVEKFPFRERKRIRPKVLTNRLLEELYNIDCVLEAFAIIQKEYPEAELTVSADGDQRPRLERLVKEMELRNVRFTGFVTNAEMAELYSQADIYMISPNTDNMSGSIIECFAAGLPVVATNVGGIPYIVEHERTGLLVEKNDHRELAQQAIRLIEDEELARELIRNARAECSKYEWQAIRTKWLDLYQEVAANG